MGNEKCGIWWVVREKKNKDDIEIDVKVQQKNIYIITTGNWFVALFLIKLLTCGISFTFIDFLEQTEIMRDGFAIFCTVKI